MELIIAAIIIFLVALIATSIAFEVMTSRWYSVEDLRTWHTKTLSPTEWLEEYKSEINIKDVTIEELDALVKEYHEYVEVNHANRK